MSELHDAAEVADAVGSGDAAGIPSLLGLVDGVATTLLQGAAIARAGVSFAAELTRITIGRSAVTPARGDWRFQDPAWTDNPAYRRVAQTYLAACAAVDSVVDGIGEDWHRSERARFVMGILTSAAAPTNTLLGNPAALKRAFETGGRSLKAGAGNFIQDLVKNGAMPATSKPGVLKVGEDLAVTAGGVVQHDEYAEVIQYRPATTEVRARPLLVVPPPIGRYYFLDLQPGRSFVEYSVSRGLQTFLLSWRNPSPDQADWDLDTYAARILTAIDAVREVTGSDDVNVIGFCAGGILNTSVLNYLAARGDDRVHAVAYAVTLLDFGHSAPIGAFSSAKLLSIARWNSRRAGVISARAMTNVFSWMRPNDLVWNYWVNNYLMGEDPPVFDILSWNADGTNLPAALHRQFLDIFERNPIVQAGELTVLDVPIDLERIKVPTYVTGAVNDHLTPWKGCFRTTQVMQGESTFALSNAGHIASLVNPPGNPKASYFTAPLAGVTDPDEWLAGAEKRTGSWWEHWADWAVDRSGAEVPAPAELGSVEHPVISAAPGVYVRQPN